MIILESVVSGSVLLESNFVALNVLESEVVYAVGRKGDKGDPGEADVRMGGVLLGDPNAGLFTVGTKKAVLRIPVELDGMSLFSVGAGCSTAASSGVTTIQYRRVRAGVADVSMLSTPLTIDANEIDTKTAATPSVINPSNRIVLEGDQIHFDVSTVGTGALGVFVSFTFKTI